MINHDNFHQEICYNNLDLNSMVLPKQRTNQRWFQPRLLPENNSFKNDFPKFYLLLIKVSNFQSLTKGIELL